MLKKHSLFAITLLCGSSIYANVPIESRGLSQSNSGSISATNDQPVATNLNWQLMQKNQQLENDIRVLRGQLEEQAHAIDQLKKDLANRYTDLDQRLELLNQKVDPDSAATDENAATDANGATPAISNNAQAPVNADPQPTPAEPAIQNDQQPASNTAQTATENKDSNELDKAAYTVALDAYKQGGAKKAIAPMENFIKNHPDSIYTPNAYFWLAEFHLATDPVNYAQAKKNYQIVADKYPTSSKAPRSLYQLYSIAKDVDRKPAIATQYKNKLLSRYPQSEEAGFIKK
ncbi:MULTISPECIES: YbgF trimerization domain-containing protein [unclassified Acinetobacter]|uniref:YbgF trimerization domain-containing protein n=1 Tax=unclassified Acinetobacter TaxID=196816 RepID=UPI001909BFA0|nr:MULTISPECIES: YbgF trimerization domain-containing protein [unclassified Acinetobacter]MBK0063371.1 tetratricopeptide repeat protein [Acinetobacter sp. S55]MBK0066717.1 tetratricopeptide repeat protein [Acinetobacter sp. S54]